MRLGEIDVRQKKLLELEHSFLKHAARRSGRRQAEVDDSPATPISTVTASVLHPLSLHVLHLED